MTTKVKIKRLDTTVGELIAAIIDAAREITADERRAYHLTGFVLNQMLRPVPVTVSHRSIRRRRV
jgi:hypothetical protein